MMSCDSLRGCSLLIYWCDSDRVAFLVLILVMYNNEQLMMDHFEHNNEKCCAIYLKEIVSQIKNTGRPYRIHKGRFTGNTS